MIVSFISVYQLMNEETERLEPGYFYQSQIVRIPSDD